MEKLKLELAALMARAPELRKRRFASLAFLVGLMALALVLGAASIALIALIVAVIGTGLAVFVGLLGVAALVYVLYWLAALFLAVAFGHDE